MLSEKRIKKYFANARLLAESSDFDGTKKNVKIGCVLVYKNSIVATGYNTAKEHPTQQFYNQFREFDDTGEKPVRNTLHAEMSTMLRARYLNIDFNKCNLFVYRLKGDGTIGLAKPCGACEKFARELGIKNVYYTTEGGWAYERYE